MITKSLIFFIQPKFTIKLQLDQNTIIKISLRILQKRKEIKKLKRKSTKTMRILKEMKITRKMRIMITMMIIMKMTITIIRMIQEQTTLIIMKRKTTIKMIMMIMRRIMIVQEKKISPKTNQKMNRAIHIYLSSNYFIK